MNSTINPTPSPIPASQALQLVGAITGILTLLGAGFLAFYGQICSPQLEYSQRQATELQGNIRELTQAVQENNALLRQLVQQK
ncbi:hypothetical protein DO97_00990 [Neosynechococcus sphagnicola sy1]|uniref:Uncharacterized protein n=1 Tax=Neosynechococcus sphagnicola sy1 TaxID=1497020 RepID=A0A098THA1_9CYAN|nr:hypothetical protein [Neosynechococcus sphagnicola]KGF71352.1 hypothetical protein DO97_00990 [Neosynechococcus sphagnicola sy1]